MSHRPLISIIVTCCNQQDYISKALDSIFQQTYDNWECLIVDDGSTDFSSLEIQKWQARDERFIFLQKQNEGVSSARNTGLAIAGGEYIQFLDGDDFLEPNKLESSIDLMKQHATMPDILLTNFQMWDEKKQQFVAPYCVLKPEFFNLRSVLLKWEELFTIPIHCGLFRHSIIENIKFPVSLRAKEDWVFWILVFHQTPQVLFLDRPLVTYRRHYRSITMSSSLEREHIQALEYLEDVLSNEEYRNFLKEMCFRYYRTSLYFKSEYFKLKRSRIFWFGNMTKNLKKKLKIVFRRNSL